MKLSTILVGAISTVSAFGKGELYVYQDYSAGIPPGGFGKNFKDMMDSGITDVLLSFWLPTQHVDSLYTWSHQLDDSSRKSAKQVVEHAGGKLLMSVGGSTFGGWWTLDAKAIAKQAVEDAKKYQFDGIDYDLEGSEIGRWVNFVMEFVTATRNIAPEMFLTIAPQPPYFSPNFQVDLKVACKFFDNGADGKPIVDKILMQYYNNPESTSPDNQSYPTLDGILKNNNQKSSVQQIFDNCQQQLGRSIPKERMIIGRPARPNEDAGAPEPLKLDHIALNCEGQGIGAGGLMLWKYRDADQDLYRGIQSCQTKHETISTLSTNPVPKVTQSVMEDTNQQIRDRERQIREELARKQAEESRRKKESEKAAISTTEASHIPSSQSNEASHISSNNSTADGALSFCKAKVIGKLPEWTAHCHELCQYFINPAFCGTKSGSEYVSCVLAKSPPGSCIAAP